jgi:hypothetical protein
MKNYLLVLLPFLAFEWLIGVLCYSYRFFQILFEVINFPFIYLYRWLESKSSEWWFDFTKTTLINDEIGQLISFLIMGALQALILYLLLRLIGALKK